MEFLIVKFDDDGCGVIIDGASGTWKTNERLQLQAGTYVVTLQLAPGRFEPPTREFRLANTDPDHPMTIRFTKVP